MNLFAKRLKSLNPLGTTGRRWLFVPYDQLSDRIGPLSREEPDRLGIVLVESRWKPSLRKYHKQKLALVLANMRQFALEQASRGVAVRYVFSDEPYAQALQPVIDELGPLEMMTPAERELRVELSGRIKDDGIRLLAHEGWLTQRAQFLASAGDQPPWRMDRFYRHVRKDSGILMQDGKPEGGKYSFDAANRKPWNGEPAAPAPVRFTPDPVTREVGELVETVFADHPGRMDLSTLPATADDAGRLWRHALEHCMEQFGPYEDAMSVRSGGLFHTRIAPLLNLHRLLPRQVVDDVLEGGFPLESTEGFVRQVLGWREFVRHVHQETDGFRKPTFDLDAGHRLPAAYWGEAPSGLHCLDHVVEQVWDEGWTHHIPRLMVLANIASLLDVSPRELSDWFWVAYTDAYDWVVEPNVIAMGSYGVGDLMTTKPYVSGAGYIHRMSDFCGDCAFDPKNNCPLTPMYWAYLDRHKDTLQDNLRMKLPMSSLKKRDPARRKQDGKIFETVRTALETGERLDPAMKGLQR